MKNWAWNTPSGYVRASHVRRVAQILRVLGLINYPINLTTLEAWAKGERKAEQKNQSIARRIPFPVARSQLKIKKSKGKITFFYPEESLFLLIAWNEARKGARGKVTGDWQGFANTLKAAYGEWEERQCADATSMAPIQQSDPTGMSSS